MNGSESDQKITLSVVIPFYDEEGSLRELHRQIDQTVGVELQPCEFIFVDDGSTDKSNEIVQALRKEDERIRLITLRRNQGKSAALAVAFKAARGKYVVTMDADLQDDPAEIPLLINKLNEGYDLVSGWKKKRHDPITKTIPSKLFNGVTSLLSGIPLHDFNCGLKIYRNEVIKEITMYGERHRFIPVLAYMRGFRVGELPVKHHPRVHGKTKFGLYRFIAGFFDLITLLFRMKFLTKPLHLFGGLGLISLTFGMAIIIYLSVGWFHGRWIGNRPLLQIGVLGIVAGVQLFTLGLLGEMVVEERHQLPPLREDSDIEVSEEG
ncbi:MAG: glycosyltransferase [Calditrichaeota bacterium]|nr:glycosyltransferase [Calditrichota bacterium]